MRRDLSCRTIARAEHHPRQLPHGGTHFRIAARRNRIEILLQIPRHHWVGRWYRPLEIACLADDSIELPTEPHSCSEEPLMGRRTTRSAMHKADGFRPPAFADE